MKKLLLALVALSLPMMLNAQIVSDNSSQHIQGTTAINRGYPVNVQLTDGSGGVYAPPISTGAATSANQTTQITNIGSPGDTTCATDTGSCGINALVQRNNQRLSTINTTLGTPLQAGGTVVATQSGTWNVTNVSGTVSLPTGASTSALQTTGNTSLSTIATNTGAATPAGTNTIGGVVARPVYGANTTTFASTSAGGTGAGNITGGNRMVYGVIASNKNLTTWAFLKIYNLAGTPTVGTDVPILIIPIAPGQMVYWETPYGRALGTGISVAVTTGSALADVTGPASGDVFYQIEYL